MSTFSGFRSGDRRRSHFLRNGGWHWTYNLMLLGIFLFAFVYAFIVRHTLITHFELSRALCLFGLSGILIPWKIYRRRLGISGSEVVGFNLLGIGPLITSALLVLNYTVVTNRYTEDFAIQSAEAFSSVYYENYAVIFELQNEGYAHFPVCRIYEVKPGHEDLSKAKMLRIRTDRGLLGYPVFRFNELI